MKKVILSCVISLIVTFFLIEIFFRLWYPQSEYSITHSPYGFKHIPNTTVHFYKEVPKFGWGQKGIEIRYNRYGLRSPNYVLYDNRFWLCDTPYEYKRIMLIGDSWVEDMGSERDNLLNIRMTKSINWTYRDSVLHTKIPIYQTINAGHYAFDNAQELMWYEMEGTKYKPDIVFLFYAGDQASSEYAHISDSKLVITPKVFTPTQRAYRAVVSVVRRKTHFGSWLLNRINRIRPINSYLSKKGLKDKDIVVAGPNTKPKMKGYFREIDAMIYKRLDESVKKDGGTLIMVHCYNDWGVGKVKFFEENNIKYLNLDYDVLNKDKWKKRKRDAIRDGIYDKSIDSHRFGYGNNKNVALQLIEYLKKEKLI